MKKIIVLGSTGSIGRSTLDVIRNRRDFFRIVAISAHSKTGELLAQADEFGVDRITLSGTDRPVSDRIVYYGESGLLRMIRDTQADIVVNGISGSRGLLPSAEAVGSGKRLALANKETIVMAGSLIRKLASENGAEIIPVDSEHSGIFHLLRKQDGEFIDELILTASGGAFRDLPKEKLHTVSLEDALRHPTWDMGPKITIDSATMANKGLEVIEAKGLFDVSVEKIKVLIHPQSCVHALIRTGEGTLYAQLSRPDMKVPIQNALTYPDLLPCPFGRLDLEGSVLEFRKPDFEKYPMLKLAYGAAGSGGGLPIVYNAANEVAVSAFMEKMITYTDIPRVVEGCLDVSAGEMPGSFNEVFRLDAAARETAGIIIKKIM